MLHTVAKLAKDIFWHVRRVLADEVDTDPFGADQTCDLLNLIDQRFRGIIKQQMRFVKEESKFGLVRIPNLGEFLEQFRQEPEQESRVEFRCAHELVRGENVDHPAPVCICAHQVRQRQRRLAEECGAP